MRTFRFHQVLAGAAILLLAFTIGCGNSGSEPEGLPTVTTVIPRNGATDRPLNGSVSATFSEPMDPATLTAATFTLKSGTPPVLIPGTVSYANSTAVFNPTNLLASETAFTAEITTGAESATGVGLAATRIWTFNTGNAVAEGLPVDLGAAGMYVILAKSAVSTVPTSTVTGNIGLSPAAATFVTGFSLIADAANVYSTSTQVNGHVYAADYALPTPSNLTTAVGDMELAFTDAAGRASSSTELGAGDIGGLTLEPGVYRWGTGLLIPTDVTLEGSATDIWIFQVAQDLTVSSGAKVVLSGGALPQNITWQVAGGVDLGTTAHLEGVVLGQTAITLDTGASINGRLLAQTAVTLDAATVVAP